MTRRVVTFILCVFTLLLSSCNKGLEPFPDNGSNQGSVREGIDGLVMKKTMILFSEGYNNLENYMEKNIEQLESGEIPGKWGNTAIVVVSHLASSRSDFKTPTAPVIFRIYDSYGTLVRDTLKVYPEETVTASKEFLRESLEFIKNNVRAASYGLVYSSHGCSWVPKDYSGSFSSFSLTAASPAGLCHPMERNPNATVLTKYVGAQYQGSYRDFYSLDLEEFCEALPMHFEYIAFDACLMGAVEVAYAFRNACDWLIASPTEIVADGLEYTKMAGRLLALPQTDLTALCEDYYKMCADGGDCTIGLYDMSKVEALAEVCSDIFEARRSNLSGISPSTVQDYNYSYNFSYDLRDMIVKMKASEEELGKLDKALEDLIVYKNATDSFLGTRIDKDRFSGISTYLPAGNSSLTLRYKETEWNVRTGLVK